MRVLASDVNAILKAKTFPQMSMRVSQQFHTWNKSNSARCGWNMTRATISQHLELRIFQCFPHPSQPVTLPLLVLMCCWVHLSIFDVFFKCVTCPPLGCSALLGHGPLAASFASRYCIGAGRDGQWSTEHRQHGPRLPPKGGIFSAICRTTQYF